MFITTKYKTMTELQNLVANGQWQNIKHVMPVWGLVDVIRKLGPNLQGAEVGVHSGLSSYTLLSECSNIDLLIGIDHYQQYEDWNGTVSQATQDQLFEIIKQNADFIGSRFNILRATSIDAAKSIPDQSLDFVYIDGDHSTEAVYQDLIHYVPKVKSGGIVSGHDIGLVSVSSAINHWRHENDPATYSELERIPNNSWYWIKN